MRYIIGIDPDTQELGYAEYDTIEKTMTLKCVHFFELLDILIAVKDQVKVVKIEAGYLNKKANFHGEGNTRTAARIGSNTGACNEVAKKVVEMCKYLGISYVEVKPYRKIWKNGKISHQELQYQLDFRGVKLYNKTTNQDNRDACLIALIG